MASNLLQHKLVQSVTQTIRSFGTVHYITFGLTGGAGMAYAAQREKYLQVPIAFLFPYMYGGYHLYKNKESVIQWFHKCPVVLRKASIKE
jgi:hypothetical protein